MQTILIILIAIVLLGGGYFYYSQNSQTDSANTGQVDGLAPPQNSDISTDVNTGSSGTPSAGTPPTNTGTVNPVQEFSFTNQGFTFNPGAFAVKKGDRVKVTFKNGGGTHDFRIDGYNVGTEVLESNKQQTFEFVADKAGAFEFYCSVGNHRAMGMKGVFTVTE